MKADYVHKDTLTATDYVELNKNNELLISYNQELLKENQELKKQLDYLRSGEYYNQLRFENEMLQQVVDTNGVPSEVYDYIDCTHRNTELLEENKKYKEVIDKAINDLDIIIDIVREQPFGDRWIINRLEANKNILKEVE